MSISTARALEPRHSCKPVVNSTRSERTVQRCPGHSA